MRPHKGKITLFPINSPGWLWNWASQKFKLNPGTLMALANASNSKANFQIKKVLQLKNRIKDSYVDEFINKIEEVLKYTEKDAPYRFNHFDNRFTVKENKISMIMKIIQEMSQKIMEENISYISGRFNVDPSDTYLSLSGGFSLNCPTNTYLMNKYKFKGFICPPCTNDSGLALGVGMYGFYKNMNERINFKFTTPYLGHYDPTLNDVLNSTEDSYFIKSITKSHSKIVVEDIKRSPIIWFNGCAEVGPRALGNRSILADPTKTTSKDYLNQIKQREWWRPVAPIVLREDLTSWFENSFVSNYMLHTFKVKEAKQAAVPAICHLDNTARVQSLEMNENKDIYLIIKRFKEITGIPMLCNTSLNDKGEPIINTIAEALNFALRKQFPVIYINGFRIELQNHSEYKTKTPLQRAINFEIFNNEEKEKLRQELNPHHIPTDLLEYFPILQATYPNDYLDITNKKEAKKVRRRMMVLKNHLKNKI
ncbi:carbamoyltransferase C-terminal domain-containing protein [Cytobacillus purgationiresistens]|uniref:carbamoyltransferase C-terminal domain-containing protein n=1 Tax=Cytobacillus purgationiresistens TaxID=863449 RepID=UPI0027D90FEB|nr:carbamoyltransferase C-terminal domain-containing protein [Cytobacillus purgationiresistens]